MSKVNFKKVTKIPKKIEVAFYTRESTYPWSDRPCTLCEESHGDTMLYCGGPVDLICPRCKKVVDKYMELREAHLERWNRVLEERKKAKQNEEP